MPTCEVTIANYVEGLRALGACSEAIEWAKSQASPAELWQICHRGDWMLWLCGKMAGEPGSDARGTLVLAACECARLALPHVPADEKRPLRAIETAERWARGKSDVTTTDVRAAACDAANAANVACDAAWAANAAAANVASDAAWAANAAAARAASAAASAAAWAAARGERAARAASEQILRQCAGIVRKHYPEPPELGARG
jgi:hypothetical protein